MTHQGTFAGSAVLAAVTLGALVACTSPTDSKKSASVDLTSDLVVWLKFNDENGSTASDSSGNGNDVDLVNDPTWTTEGAKDGALTLSQDATDEIFQYGTVTEQTLSGDFTLAAYVKLPDPRADDGLVGVQGTGPDVNFYLGYPRLFQYADANAADSHTGSDVLVATKKVTTDGWTHVAFVRSGSTTTVYVGGVASGSTSVWTQPLKFSSIGWGNAGYLTGSLDDLRVYHRALTAAEVKALLN